MSRLLQGLLGFARRIKLFKILTLAFGTIFTAVCAYIVYLFAARGYSIYANNAEELTYYLVLAAISLLCLIILLARRVVHIWLYRVSAKQGNDLLKRLVKMFVLTITLPVCIIAIAAYLFIEFSVHNWFDNKVQTAINQSLTIAESYKQEHRLRITTDAEGLSREISKKLPFINFQGEELNTYLTSRALTLSLADAAIIEGNTNKIVARNILSNLPDEIAIPKNILDIALRGQVSIFSSNVAEKVFAVIQLPNFRDRFLIVGRYIDPVVIEQSLSTEDAVIQYRSIKSKIDVFKKNIAILMIILMLLLLLISIWLATLFAHNLARPISSILAATSQIKDGDYKIDVDTKNIQSLEMRGLAESFNSMAGELNHQRHNLVAATKEIDEKRKFNQAVLFGVSTGVIALDNNLKVSLINSSACRILNVEEGKTSEKLSKVIPEAEDLITAFKDSEDKETTFEINIQRKRQNIILLARIAKNKDIAQSGYILTFDDITELSNAQRRAAWSDVAQKIAHEIKNPLTPINLSAQRIKKKYTKEVTSDPEMFSNYVDTIIKYSEDISNIIRSFSDFAKLPKPKLAEVDFSKLLDESIKAFKVSYSNVAFEVDKKDDPLNAMLDKGQINQVLVNLVKNAAEALEEVDKAKIKINLQRKANKFILKICDNGEGFPESIKDRLTEPYVTSKEKGTGLGLAITKKIIEEHNGEIKLFNLESKKNVEGACIEISLPLLVN